MQHRTRIALGVLCGVWLAGGSLPAQAQPIPPSYQEVLNYLGKTGDYKDNVLKVNIPRNDIKVSVDGVPTPTPFGFGGWVAMTKNRAGSDVMMGDLVLTQDEVNPVMSALLDHGLEVTALHNHFFWEEPRMYYMHVHGMGASADLARRVKPALDLIGHVPTHSQPSDPPAVPGKLDTAKIAQIVGHRGEEAGPVYKITVGRDDLKLVDMGAPVNARMGLNTWAAFYGTDANAEVAGDVAMLGNEITPVLKALRSHGLDGVAIHQHMTDTQPMVFFLHYWGRGPADKLASSFRAALDQLGKEHPAPHTHPVSSVSAQDAVPSLEAAP